MLSLLEFDVMAGCWQLSTMCQDESRGRSRLGAAGERSNWWWQRLISGTNGSRPARPGTGISLSFRAQRGILGVLAERTPLRNWGQTRMTTFCLSRSARAMSFESDPNFG